MTRSFLALLAWGIVDSGCAGDATISSSFLSSSSFLRRGRFRTLPTAQGEAADAAASLLKFWEDTPAAKNPIQPTDGNGYLSFESDGGGFNNMRMAFEYFVQLAQNSGRTLVLPPREGWYLLDWGPIISKGKTDWMEGSPRSTYQEFFDVDYLKRQIPVLSAEEFYEKERDRLKIPKASAPDQSPTNTPDTNPWKAFLRQNTGTLPRSCSEGSAMAVDKSHEHLHFGYGFVDGKDTQEHRFFACKPTEDGATLLHFNPALFNVAAGAVGALGAGKYTALHLRRNDFQYHQAPGVDDAQGTALLQQVAKELEPNEAVYIASDETDSDFIQGFRLALEGKGHKMYSLLSFKDDLTSAGMTSRNTGSVEEIICAGARNFLGTPKSTYSDGIMQLRQRLASKMGEMKGINYSTKHKTLDF